MATSTNCDVACFYVTKHSWKGKYKRIFSVGTLAITTYNPSSFEITNQWAYGDFFGIAPNVKVSGEFTISMKKGVKKVDTMRFSSEHQRADVVTEALRFRHLFADVSKESWKYVVYKHHWSDTRLPVVLVVNEASLDQCDPTTHRVLASYDYKEMEAVVQISDYPGAFAVKHGGFGRLHLFISDRQTEIIKRICDSAFSYVGVSVRQKKDKISLEEFNERRFGKFSTDESLTSLAEFTVQKICDRHTDPMRRILALSETCIIERDPGSYSIATCKPLSDVFAVVRCQENPQLFSIEYVKGQLRTYISTDRDSLLASLIDGVRASGNAGVHVRMVPTCRGHRLGPFTLPVDEEVESMHLRFINQPPVDWSFNEAVQRFNANLPYSGLLHAVTQDGLFSENKEKPIHQALNTMLDREGDQTLISNEDLESQFHAIRRLAASKAGFAAFTQLTKFRERFGVKVISALKRNDPGTTYAAVDTICAFMEPMHVDCDLRQQQLNKSSLLATKPFMESMLDMFVNHVTQGSGALVVAAMLDFLNYALCAPYSETTFGSHFDVLLEMVAARGRSLFKLFQHPSMAIVKGAGLVMKAIIEEGEAEIAAKMQDLALAEGALPRHLHTAMFTNSSDSRMLTNRQLSRHLVGLWVTGHPTAMGLLKRILPPGLLGSLDSSEKIPDKEVDRMHVRDNLKLAQDHSNKTRRNPRLILLERHVEDALRHWRSRIGTDKKDEKLRERPIVLRKRRERIKSEANWPLFYWRFNQDHAKANLIWNFKTREELREALEEEIRAFNVDRNLGGNVVISWNHQEFEVQYRCLADEIKIGDYYLRLLLEEDAAVDETSSIRRSYEFFNDLYHRFLLAPKVPMRCMCLQAMAIVYGRHHEEIGAFNDTKFIVTMLSKCTDRLERDRLIFFLNKLILNRRNVKELIEANGIKVLVELLTLAHLHVSRATVPAQGNVIEASQAMLDSREKEWYYGNVEKERSGPYSFPEMKEFWDKDVINAHTKCWAQGMDGWQQLGAIPQLKWSLVAENSPIVNESDLATVILNMLIRICEYFPSRDVDGAIVRPFPRAKRLLSDAVCLPHIVQLLLTFEPVLVEKVTTLLYVILLDNPTVSQLYLTGMFFFILMYTGSNVVPIGRVLQSTHTKQAFRSEENQCSDIMLRSILGQILPEAMVCYLENYGAEKFSEIFLGEFDTPEVIWNSEMRRMMIQKLAAHVADFTPRLLSNIRALYHYCPIPAIAYPQLENELFCNMYYLRHLCDSSRFPDWPIKEPIKLLKDVLEAWKKEVEKKPPSMSKDDAFEVLGLDKGVDHDEGIIRKAYFRLAQKHHPDKNPDGREMFEKVNKAYEFLCSRSSRSTEGPDPVNIVLILRVQSILFGRYKDVLHPYKYAGYPMLIKTITAETDDERLFSKSAPLLDAATELAYHTVNCSTLNAEELRREHGLQLLQRAFTRCVSILSHSSKMEDVAVAVSSNIVRCFGVASLFATCRERITELPEFINDLCRILYYKHLPKLCSTAVECVCAFSVDSILQMRLLQAGVLWHLLLFLFNYDFTLQEGGVERSESTNWQEVANQLAIISVRACARLGGYLESSGGANATPDNVLVQKSLRAMLTPYVTKQFANENPAEVLKILNSNTENPYLVWDNATRAELIEFLESQQTDKIRTGESDPNFGADFIFSVHNRELIVGEIFVRVYNEQPAFPIENAKGFAIDLLEYLDSESEYLHSLMALIDDTVPNGSTNERVRYVEMALKALSNVIKNHSGVEIQCIGHFKVLFSFLRLNGFTGIQRLILEVISCVTGNKECIKDIAAMEVLPYLLFVFQSLSTETFTVLEILYSLSSNTNIVKECVYKGAVVYLLDVFCNSTDAKTREKTAELLSKMTADKLVGPKLRLVLTKFLPPIFMDAMRDSPEASIHLFQGVQENPELIWNDDVRNKVCDVVNRFKSEHVNEQRLNANATWKLPEDLSTVYADLHDEIVVGGVYLRLFISSPAWVLRRPKEFLEDLLCTCLDLMNRDRAENDKLEMVTTATVSLFQAQPNIAELVPNLGHIPRMLKAIATSRNGAVHKSCLLIIHQLAHNSLCVQNFAHCDCIHPIKEAMKARADMVGVACEALYLIFERQHEELVLQALNANLITYLLDLLERGLDNVENPSSTRAQIVKALKSAARSLQYGDQVSGILEKSKIWLEYKDQKHDLFITTTNTSGYLTGTMPGVAGYLMQGSTKSMPCAPPPISTSDDLPTP